jgi:hypothetical protein
LKKGEALSGLGTNVARREDLLKDFLPQHRTAESELFARNPDRHEKGRWVSEDGGGRLVASAETTHYQTRFSTTYRDTKPRETSGTE